MAIFYWSELDGKDAQHKVDVVVITNPFTKVVLYDFYILVVLVAFGARFKHGVANIFENKGAIRVRIDELEGREAVRRAYIDNPAPPPIKFLPIR